MSITESLDPETTPGDPPARIVGRRLGPWIALLALPLIALALLAAEPDLDQKWEHYPSHFWLVLTVAAVNVALGLVASEAAARRDDARTFFVSMALLASAGFLGLHALATPRILVDHTTAGFSVAARVGLLLAAGFAAISALDPDTRVVRVLARHHRQVRTGLGLVLAAWAVAALARVPLLDRPCHPTPRRDPSASWRCSGSRCTASPRFATRSCTGMSREEAAVLERSARELSRVDELFRLYVAPQLAASLRRQPERARLGGEEHEVSVLFADLAGFTAFSAERPASAVVEMLNRYWAAAVPEVVTEGGFIERFAGDAIIVAFNAVTEQSDHALRAARAALAVSSGAERLAADHADWPRFRIAVNTGPAVVGNVGADLQRSFTVIGDTINLAARLQTQARPGEVVIGPTTRETLGDRARVVPLGDAELKGKPEPVPVYRLVSVTG